MHPKQIMAWIPLPNFKLFYTRITSSRLTLFYVILAFFHCILQVVFQVLAFRINANATASLTAIVNEGEYGAAYAFVEANGPLHLCRNKTEGSNPHDCPIIWQAAFEPRVGEDNLSSSPALSSPTISSTPTPTPSLSSSPQLTSSISSLIPTSTGSPPSVTRPLSSIPSSTSTQSKGAQASNIFTILSAVPQPTGVTRRSIQRRTLQAQAVSDANNNLLGVQITGLDGGPVTAPLTCVEAIVWPRQILRQTEAEDITLLAFQIWALGMSLVAILNESIPHIIAALTTHFLATAWSGFQLVHTAEFRSEFNRLVTNGACLGVNLLPHFWGPRNVAEISLLCLNSVVLVTCAFLTWKLVKVFGWQTFKRVGASLVVNRVYKFVLSLSIFIQLAFFFIVALAGLWMYILYNSNVVNWSSSTTMFKQIFICLFFVLIPWLCLGWCAARRELRFAMWLFLALSGILIGFWAAMFVSSTYRFSFQDWRFFSVISVAAAVLTIITIFLAVVCFFNFGKGLMRYLHSDELPDDNTFGPTDIEKNSLEKVGFPMAQGDVPTFSIALHENSLPHEKSSTIEDSDDETELGHESRLPLSHSRDLLSKTMPSTTSAGAPGLERATSSGSNKTTNSHHNGIGSYHVAPPNHHHRQGSDASVISGKQRRWIIE